VSSPSRGENWNSNAKRSPAAPLASRISNTLPVRLTGPWSPWLRARSHTETPFASVPAKLVLDRPPLLDMNWSAMVPLALAMSTGTATAPLPASAAAPVTSATLRPSGDRRAAGAAGLLLMIWLSFTALGFRLACSYCARRERDERAAGRTPAGALHRKIRSGRVLRAAKERVAAACQPRRRLGSGPL